MNKNVSTTELFFLCLKNIKLVVFEIHIHVVCRHKFVHTLDGKAHYRIMARPCENLLSLTTFGRERESWVQNQIDKVAPNVNNTHFDTAVTFEGALVREVNHMSTQEKVLKRKQNVVRHSTKYT